MNTDVILINVLASVDKGIIKKNSNKNTLFKINNYKSILME